MKGLLWLFLLLQAVTFSCAEPQANQRPLGGDGADETNGDSFRVEVAAQSGGQTAREPGADLVDSALVELRKLHQPLHHRARKQHGVVGTLLHFALKALPTLRLTAPVPESSKNAPSGKLLQATKLLEESARQNNSDARYILAEMNFYGNFSYPRNFSAAFDYYHQLALLNGNSSAMYMVGLMYSTGIGGAVERDQARALLYYTFAANKGHTRAEMTVAHRHHAGIGTPKNCEMAVKYYKRAADKAVGWYRSGPPGGRSWIAEAYRIADETGGAYGEGASVVSAGQNAVKAHAASDAHASIEDIIEYLDLMSQKGDFKASFNLGRIYYEGQRGLDKNLPLARRYFYEVTQKYWKKNRPVENPKVGLDKTAAKAAGYIGRMHMRGEGTEQNFDRARFWFERGANLLNDAQSQHGLGLLYLHGYGIKADIAQALDCFRKAAMQDYAPAQVQLGYLYLDHGSNEDIDAGNHYFEMAARWANIEAYYHLAESNNIGVSHERSCSTAVSYYKNVAERAEPLVSSWAEANLAYEAGDTELALLEYLGAAEQGYEKAQNNVAYILDPEKSRLPLAQLLSLRGPPSPLLQDPTLALISWTRSSRQGNTDALVKMGDYYLYGIGTDADVDKAVQCYTGASEYYQSAQALYNLGWMHEHGVGLDQDYHLAKRHYDAALATNEEAYLPVTLSLLKLRAKSAWNTLTHGGINSIKDEPAPKKEWSLSDWINNFLQDDAAQYYDDTYDEMYEDETMPGGDPLEFDDGIMESVVILGLAAALVFLVMYRQQRQQAARRQEEEARRQQQHQGVAAQGGAVGGNQPPPPERGFFPQPGDPDFGQWAAGGVGH